jgi:hypothetical protein
MIYQARASGFITLTQNTACKTRGIVAAVLLKNQVFWPNIPEEWNLEIHCTLATVNLVTAALHNLTIHLVQVFHYIRREIIATH